MFVVHHHPIFVGCDRYVVVANSFVKLHFVECIFQFVKLKWVSVVQPVQVNRSHDINLMHSIVNICVVLSRNVLGMCSDNSGPLIFVRVFFAVQVLYSLIIFFFTIFYCHSIIFQMKGMLMKHAWVETMRWKQTGGIMGRGHGNNMATTTTDAH